MAEGRKEATEEATKEEAAADMVNQTAADAENAHHHITAAEPMTAAAAKDDLTITAQAAQAVATKSHGLTEAGEAAEEAPTVQAAATTARAREDTTLMCRYTVKFFNGLFILRRVWRKFKITICCLLRK